MSVTFEATRNSCHPVRSVFGSIGPAAQHDDVGRYDTYERIRGTTASGQLDRLDHGAAPAGEYR